MHHPDDCGQLFDLSSELMFVGGPEGRMTQVNAAWERFLGWQPSHLEGRRWLDLVHEDDRDTASEALAGVLAGGRPVTDFECRMSACGGGEHVLSWRLHLGQAGDRLYGLGRDVTEQQRIEAREAGRARTMALLLAGAPHRMVLDAVVQSVEATQPDTVCTLLMLTDDGRRVQVVCGDRMPEAYNRAMHDAEIGPDAGSCGTAAYLGQRVISENIHTDPRWAGYRDLARLSGMVSCWSEPVRDGSGRVVGTFAMYRPQEGAPDEDDIALITDAAQMAALAIERMRAEQALRLARFTLDHVALSMFLIDAQSRFIDVNETACRTLGYTRAQMLDMSVADVDPEFPAERWAEHWAELRSKGVLTFQGRHRRRDGECFDVEISAHFMAYGEREFNCAFVRDITERLQAERAQRAWELRLRETQKLESLGTLAGGIAHDFNNVLGGILGNLSLAYGELPTGHAAGPHLLQIQKGALRARDLVQQILAFSRRQAPAFTVQALQPMVEESLALLRVTLPPTVELSTRFEPAPLWVRADATQMHQVVVNLCTNAWHALGGQPGQVEVGLARVADGMDRALPQGGELPPGPHAHLWVRDTGCGIDEAHLHRLFEPFFTTKPVGQGTGLGLPVAHGIVTSHGGRIAVDSRPAQGTTFHVYLPLHEAQLQGTAAPALEGATAVEGDTPVALPAPVSRGLRVLYVDDDEVMLVMVEGLLLRAGHRVVTVSGAGPALELLRGQPEAVDVLVTDYNMPGASGLDLAAAVQAIRPDLPIILSSGYLSEELQTRALQMGLRAVLNKEQTVERLPGLLAEIPAGPAAAHA